jgi:hypothetical protein
MKKYTEKVIKRLYGQKIFVFFRDMHGEFRGLFRDKDMPPYSVKDIEKWNRKHKASITFSKQLYSKRKLAIHAWNTIVHEATHYEENISCNNDRQLFHSDEFKMCEKKNLQEVDDLRKRFNKEIGLKEGFTYDDSEEDYLEESESLME